MITQHNINQSSAMPQGAPENHTAY